jgi:hypothetical protein
MGGGSGHYPAFCGIVGPGSADDAVVGNIFSSPSAADVASVGRAADNWVDGGEGPRRPRRGASAAVSPPTRSRPLTQPERACAGNAVQAIRAIAEAMTRAEATLGALDAVAGDGDHGRGMVRGSHAHFGRRKQPKCATRTAGRSFSQPGGRGRPRQAARPGFSGAPDSRLSGNGSADYSP